MTVPRVSICVPAYRGGRWLEACLDSALAQTFGDFEVVVVDDGSDDDTAAVAEARAGQDPRVVVHRNPSRLGLAGNWNRCVELARGGWIKFLFQDDELDPACLERMVAAAGRAPLVICERRLGFEADAPARVREYFESLPGGAELFGQGGEVPAARVQAALLEHPGVNVFGEPCALLVRRDAFERFGPFHAGMIQLCDLEFTARVACNAGFVRVAEELATFRVHGGSATAANAGEQEFRKDVLDTLVLYHEYAFAPAFKPLRRAARAAAPPISLSALAARQLQRAQRDVRWANDPALRRALDEVLRAHPRLSRPLWQLWHRVRKQVKP